MTLKITEGPK